MCMWERGGERDVGEIESGSRFASLELVRKTLTFKKIRSWNDGTQHEIKEENPGWDSAEGVDGYNSPPGLPLWDNIRLLLWFSLDATHRGKQNQAQDETALWRYIFFQGEKKKEKMCENHLVWCQVSEKMLSVLMLCWKKVSFQPSSTLLEVCVFHHLSPWPTRPASCSLLCGAKHLSDSEREDRMEVCSTLRSFCPQHQQAGAEAVSVLVNHAFFSWFF